MHGDLRAAADAAIRNRDDGRARAVLEQLMREAPTIANAHFVLDRSRTFRTTKPRGRLRLAILRSFTVEPILPLIQATAILYGLELDVWVGGFNSYAQEVLDPGSDLYRFEPDVAVIAVQTRDLAPELWRHFRDDGPGRTAVDRVVHGFQDWIAAFRSHSSADLVLQNFEVPEVPSAGILDAQSAGGQAGLITEINRRLIGLASDTRGVYVLDYDGLTARFGRRRWHDERKWLTARMPISADCLMPMAQEYIRFLLPLAGLTAKALVVDLDNTLWGGVVGEDGIDALQIDQEYPGAAYQELQRAIAALGSRGILLAVASKNNESDALEALDRHPGMILRSGDFAATRINWNDKDQSLREIADELNIGLDSLAYLDDNPAEREQIRRRLPEVTVLEFPEDPMQRATALRECPLFERLSVTDEDRGRGHLYVEQKQRAELQRQTPTLEDFLRSLQMQVDMREMSPDAIARVAQLTQKTNQFNLTTRRYSEQELVVLSSDVKAHAYQVRVSDRFGDNGLVGAAIAHDAGTRWEIDTFLLSCRVIGRTIEQAMLSRIAEDAAGAGATTLSGWFLPTKKNQPASGFYAASGFSAVDRDGGATFWELDLKAHRPSIPDWIEVAQRIG